MVLLIAGIVFVNVQFELIVCDKLSSIKPLIRNPFPMKSSIFTTEVCVIDLALNIISRDKHNKLIIFSDSLSVLTSLNNKKLENPLIVKLLSRLDSMFSH